MTNRRKPAELYTHTHTHTHTCNLLLSPKQIGTICFAIFSFVFSAPTFAGAVQCDSSLNGDCPKCKNSNLQTYSGTSNLQANWSANTIQLHWYNGDTEIQNVPVASQSCTYDDSLTPPSTIPTRTGYTFRGWRVKQFPQCNLSGLDASIGADMDADHIAWQPINGSSGYTVAQVIADGYLSGTDHSSELSNGEWRIIFSYGTVKGTSYCSGLSGDNNGYTWSDPSRATESELTSAGNGQYCWCAATSYTPSGGSACNIASPSWVFNYDAGSASDCASYCAGSCAEVVNNNVGFRWALFGVAGNYVAPVFEPIIGPIIEK